MDAKTDPLQVPVSSQPLDLRPQVPVHDIAFFVLECPGDYEQGIPLPSPDPFLDLALDAAHAGHPVPAPDPDVVCSHHQLGRGEDLPVPFLWQANADGLDP